MRTDYFDDLLPDPVAAQKQEMDRLKRDAADLVHRLESFDSERGSLNSAMEVIHQQQALIAGLADALGVAVDQASRAIDTGERASESAALLLEMLKCFELMHSEPQGTA